MAKAILKDDRDLERDYQIYGNTLITLRLEDDFSVITFYDSNDNKLDGEFLFIESDENDGLYLLGRMYAPKAYKNSGLGRAALEYFVEYTGAQVYARENDGNVRDDGSHLTEDAPGFVGKMIDEGLLIETRNKYLNE